MAEHTNIAWCDSTFNPWIGCTQVSPGCDLCYAKTLMDDRLGKARWGVGQPRVRTTTSLWRQPLLWEREHQAFELAHGHRRRVFCASLADVFDNEVPEQWRFDLVKLIAATPHLDWLLLTKRIGNAQEMLDDAMLDLSNGSFGWTRESALGNVWLGATFVDQAEWDRDVYKLIGVPAAVRFVSLEPMLGRIVMDPALITRIEGGSQHGQRFIDWVIVGGESGFPSRPMQIAWPRSVRDQCAAAGVPFFYKQWGGSRPRPKLELLDGVLHQAWPQTAGVVA